MKASATTRPRASRIHAAAETGRIVVALAFIAPAKQFQTPLIWGAYVIMSRDGDVRWGLFGSVENGGNLCNERIGMIV
jgi:hypothetical protein